MIILLDIDGVLVDNVAYKVGVQHTAREFSRRVGVPAEPPTLSSAVTNWRAGDTIPLGHKTLRVVGIRDDDADQPPVPVVEEA